MIALNLELHSHNVIFDFPTLFYETLSAYPGISHFELSQDILGHVILGHGVHHKVLVSSRPLCWPVLVAFFLLGVKNRIP